MIFTNRTKRVLAFMIAAVMIFSLCSVALAVAPATISSLNAATQSSLFEGTTNGTGRVK